MKLFFFESNITYTQFTKLIERSAITKFWHIFNPSSKTTTSEQSGKFSRTLRYWGFWRRVLLAFFFIQHSGVFGWSSYIQAVEVCWWKESIYPWSEDSIQLQLRILPEKFNIVQVSWLIAAGTYVLHSSSCKNLALISDVPCWLRGIGIWAKWLSKKFFIGTTTSWKLVGEILGSLMSFLGRDLLHSREQCVDQGRETTGFFRWKLRRSCCFEVGWKCMTWIKS